MSSEQKGSLWLAVAAVSCFATAPVVLIWAEPLTAYEKSAWRMGIAALALLVLAVARREPLRYSRRDAGKFLLFGLVTALHFVTFVASLNFTSVAHSLTVTYTAPIFVSLFSMLFLKERLAPRKYFGIAVAIAGIGVLVGFEPVMTSRMLFGDGLALLSAITFGIYSVIGRSQRNQYPLLVYTLGVYSVATLWLLGPALGSLTPSAYGPRQVLALLWVGLVPLAVGHTLYNAAIRRVHAAYVNLIATQEVTGGVLLTALFLGQIPPPNAIVGIVITLGGIALVLLS